MSLPYLPSMPDAPMEMPRDLRNVCNALTAFWVAVPYLPSTVIVPPMVFLNALNAVVTLVVFVASLRPGIIALSIAVAWYRALSFFCIAVVSEAVRVVQREPPVVVVVVFVVVVDLPPPSMMVVVFWCFLRHHLYPANPAPNTAMIIAAVVIIFLSFCFIVLGVFWGLTG